jgi:hypothetical protein
MVSFSERNMYRNEDVSCPRISRYRTLILGTGGIISIVPDTDVKMEERDRERERHKLYIIYFLSTGGVP